MTESQYQTLKAYCLRHRTDHPYLGSGQYRGTPYEEGVLSFVSRLSDLHRQGVTEVGEALVRFRRNKERYNPYSGRRKERFLDGVDFCLKKAQSVLGTELTEAETEAE